MALVWGVSLPALVLLLFALAVLERMWRRIWRAQKGLPISGQALDEFTAFLQGTKRVELDQRAAQSLMREEEQDGAPPHQIDLDRGVVFLNPPDGDRRN